MNKVPQMKFTDRIRNAAKIITRGTYLAPTSDIERILADNAGVSITGINVNASTAMKLSVVFACVRKYSELTASLPISVTRNIKGKREDLSDGPIYTLLRTPNKFMNNYSFIELMNARLQLHGNSYAVIKFSLKGEPVELIPVDPGCVRVKVMRGEPFYVVDDREMDIRGTFFYWEIIHFKILSRNGFTGMSPIAAAREGIGLGLAAERFGADFFQKGGNLKGALETEGHMDDAQFKAWKKRWETFYGGAVGDHATPILEYGMKYKALGIPPNEAQFIETRVFQLQDIARFFNMPPSLIGDLSRATFSNGEQQDMQFVKYSLQPLCYSQEAEFEQKLVNRKEQGTIDVKYNMDNLLRADMKSRAAYEQTLVSTGILTRNEARTIENKEPLEGLDTPLDPAFLSGKQPALTVNEDNNSKNGKE